MTKTNTKYYAFIGENATTGEPHSLTGGMSFWGRNRVFDTKKSRDECVDFYDRQNPTGLNVACSKRKLRDYNLGMSIYNFEQDLLYQEYVGE